MLLDSNALLFMLYQPEVLREVPLHEMEAGRRLYLSMASVWEIEIKRGTGKLGAPVDIWDTVSATGIEILAIDVAAG